MVRKISEQEKAEVEREAASMIPWLRKKIIASPERTIEIEAREIKNMLGPVVKNWNYIDILLAEPFKKGRIVIEDIIGNILTEDYFLMYIEPREEEFQLVALEDHPEIIKDLLIRTDKSSTGEITVKALDILNIMGPPFAHEDEEDIEALIYALFHNGIHASPELGEEKDYILLRLRRIKPSDIDPNEEITKELIEEGVLAK